MRIQAFFNPDPIFVREMITEIETHSLAAIPALETENYDGWLIRFARNHTHRANSVNVIHRGKLPLEAKITHCEEVYAGRRQPCHFRLTPLAEPELDPLLDQRGYSRSRNTEVRTRSLAGLGSQAAVNDVMISDTPTPAWLKGLAALTGQNPRQQRIFRDMLMQVNLPLLCAHIEKEGKIVACGLGVGSNAHLGLFEFATNPAYQRQGLAARITLALMGQARDQGIGTAYLQVVTTNASGQAFWERMGFNDILYSYHYRTKL
ncbi:GNAT family N-acetyltransferase [Sneathiella sp.]|uniref:GNAT family N-acetyltransferase n=1 Tax=Sneathiella sp. TaxID=1964365 RepID=UPI003564964B